MNYPANMERHVQNVLEGEYDLPLKDVASVLDIGANVGAYTVWARKRWPDAAITAYEPNPEALRLLNENIRGIPLVIAVGAALRAELDGTMMLRHGKNNLGEASFFDLGEQTDRFSLVSVQAADGLYADVVKIDTEGCEVEILEALDLEKVRGVALEFHRPEDATYIDSFLCARGFARVAGLIDGVSRRGTLRYVRPEYSTDHARRICICIPVHQAYDLKRYKARDPQEVIPVGLFHPATEESLFATMEAFRGENIRLAMTWVVGDGQVHRARATLLAMYLDWAKKIWWDFKLDIDADIQWHPTALLALINRDRDIIGAAYPIRGGKTHAGRWFPGATPDATGLMPTQYLGGGFVLAKHRVLERMIRAHPELRYRTNDNQRESMPCGREKDYHTWDLWQPTLSPQPLWGEGEQESISEDWAWCQRAAALGFDIWTDMSVDLRHWKDETPYRLPNYDNAIDGWMTPLELTWLRDLARHATNIIEVGSWKGRSTAAMAEVCKGTVYAVDTWEGSKGEQDGAHREARNGEVFDQFQANTGHLPVVPIRMDSVFAAAHAELPETADVVFIDAGHTYEEVKADIAAWLPRAGTVLCGHDYTDPNWPGVKQAVDEAFGDRVQTVPGASIWYVITGDAQ